HRVAAGDGGAGGEEDEEGERAFEDGHAGTFPLSRLQEIISPVIRRTSPIRALAPWLLANPCMVYAIGWSMIWHQSRDTARPRPPACPARGRGMACWPSSASFGWRPLAPAGRGPGQPP